MNSDFLRVQRDFVRQWEGGYVNNPADRGGETNLGVTAAAWRRWCQTQGLPLKDMKSLTQADVEPLYEAEYWQPLAAELPWPLSAGIYDASVNSGPGDGNAFDEAGQEAGATWVLWRATQLAPKGTPLEKALATCTAREELYQSIVRRDATQARFLAGWLNRVRALRTWLKANAEPATLGPKVFLRDTGGKNVEWDGKPTIYNGSRLTRYPDGALQLERTE